jgi:hypothetical protein
MDGSSQSALSVKEVYRWILLQFSFLKVLLKSTFKRSVTIIGLKIVEYARIARLNERDQPSSIAEGG